MEVSSIVALIAQKHGVSEDEVRQEMQAAITTGKESKDYFTKRAWRQLGFPKAAPSPEELIFAVAATLLAKSEKQISKAKG